MYLNGFDPSLSFKYLNMMRSQEFVSSEWDAHSTPPSRCLIASIEQDPARIYGIYPGQFYYKATLDNRLVSPKGRSSKAAVWNLSAYVYIYNVPDFGFQNLVKI